MNSQAKFDSSLDYSDLVAELRSGEDGLEYAAADALEALMARIAELTAALKPFADMAMSAAPASDGDTFIVGIPKASDLRAARAALEKKND